MTDIIAELRWRGLIHQMTDERLGDWLRADSRVVYIGFDPTAESLHVGSMLPLITLRRFQRAGHRPIALVGGATGMIGDPSGKSQERNLLSAEMLQRNVAGIERQMRNFLDFESGPRSALLLNNIQWMGQFGYLQFLRDVGKHFPVNVMLAKDSVKSRVDRDDAGISYTEFSYMLLQAYDFVHLYQTFGCQLQVGGSDQWGNITAGIDLARRMLGVQLYGVTGPLLTRSDGAKMGKTEEGAVWLDPRRTSPYKFFQYWINVDDQDAGKCLRFLTELEEEQVRALDRSRESEPEKKESQRRLAVELTRLVHGDAGLRSAQGATEVLFGAEIRDWSDLELADIFADVPHTELPRARLGGAGLSLVDALVAVGLAASKGEARRTISGGGAYVNNRRQDGIDTQLTAGDLASETIMVLRKGKKNYALLRFVA
jgi:tyrosyl-tRNA synthetase